MKYHTRHDVAVIRAAVPVKVHVIRELPEEGFEGGWKFWVTLWGRELGVDGARERRYRTEKAAIAAAKRAVREWAEEGLAR